MARHECVHPRRRPGVPHLLRQQPRGRADGRHLELPGHHRARASGGMGGLAGGLPPDPAVLVVEVARLIRRRRANAGVGGGWPMTSFVLIPGAGGAAWYWHRVVPLLRDAGHDAVAVDLPANDETAGLHEYARLAADATGGRDD